MATQPMRAETSERAWFGQLARERKTTEGVIVLGPEEAADWLYWGLAILEHEDNTPRRVYLEARQKAIAEIELATRGQRFRIDTAAGTFYLWDGLWKFAGRSGPMEGPHDHPKWAPPSWDEIVKRWMKREPRKAKVAA